MISGRVDGQVRRALEHIQKALTNTNRLRPHQYHELEAVKKSIELWLRRYGRVA
jgi:hypothetical protein